MTDLKCKKVIFLGIIIVGSHNQSSDTKAVVEQTLTSQSKSLIVVIQLTIFLSFFSAQRNDKTNTKVYCQKDSFDDCSVVKTPTTRLECVGDVGTKDKCLKLQHCCWDSSIKPNCYMSYKNPSKALSQNYYFWRHIHTGFNYDIYGMMSKTPIYVSYFVPSYYFVIEVPKSTAIATSSYSSSCSKVPSATAPVYSQLIKCEKEENYPSGKDPLKDGEQ